MTDQELDRALASALDVEPRADFQARVRVRVAAEPPPSFWLAPWRMAAGVAAVAVIAVAVTFWNGADEQPIGGEQPSERLLVVRSHQRQRWRERRACRLPRPSFVLRRRRAGSRAAAPPPAGR